MTLKILHFADAHIDMAAHGRHDPESGLPVRVLDFLRALDTIVDTAITERVDLVIFAGDAYRDRTPAPTFQREWGRRVMRLSQAGIPLALLVGNHDLSPAVGRAHALQEFDTLQVPHVFVLSRPALLRPADLGELPLQLIALPWIPRSGLMAALDLSGVELGKINEQIEIRLTGLIQEWLEQIDPALPAVMTAHASVQGAVYGGERSVMLGSDLVLPGSLVRDPRLDYVALGHIHKSQNLNEGQHPPVVYPGSIERVDFGEADQDKYFVIAHVDHGNTRVEWRKLEGRHFIDRSVRISDGEDFMAQLKAVLPQPQQLADAMLRLKVEYPRELEPLLDEKDLRDYTASAFEFHLVRQPKAEARLRLSADQAISSLTPLQLLGKFLESTHQNSDDHQGLQDLAEQIMREDGEDAA